MMYKVVAKAKADEAKREFTVWAETEEQAKKKIEQLSDTCPYLVPDKLEVQSVEEIKE